MGKYEPHQIDYTDEELDELLSAVDNKSIYPDASSEEHGLMSTDDKDKLDGIIALTNLEIEEILQG